MFLKIMEHCGKFLNRWEYQTTLSPEKHVSQEATVRTGHETTDWFIIGKGVQQGCILSLFTSFFLNFIFKLYIIVLVLPNIKMNPPQVYMCSPSMQSSLCEMLY